MTPHRSLVEGEEVAPSSALPAHERFMDVREPLLPSQHMPHPPFRGMAAFGLLLVILLGLAWKDPPVGPPVWPPAWQWRVASLLLLLGASGCLERHLISIQRQVRRQGHLNVYRRLKLLSRLPLLIATAGLTAALVLLALTGGQRQGAGAGGLAIRLILGAEVLALVAAEAHYCVVLLRPQQAPPDTNGHSWLASPLHPAPAATTSLRFPSGRGGSDLVLVVDRQAELLRFQEERLHHLGAEIVRLQDALAATGARPPLATGDGAQADLEYWLATREQELRTVAAERDVMAGEVRAVRTVLAEAQAEVTRLRSCTKQHAEENVRLRALRDEWSARSAKLEQSLLKLQASSGIT